MLRRMALWCTFVAMLLFAATAFGQPTPSVPADAGTTLSTPAPAADVGTAPPTTPPSTPGTYVPAGAEGNTATSAQKTEVDAATYAVRLRDLEQRINELKEQIFRSKARLAARRDRAAGRGAGGRR